MYEVSPVMVVVHWISYSNDSPMDTAARCAHASLQRGKTTRLGTVYTRTTYLWRVEGFHKWGFPQTDGL